MKKIIFISILAIFVTTIFFNNSLIANAKSLESKSKSYCLMDYATGEYIYFLDSDDEITPDCIDKLVKPLESYRYDFVTADFSLVGGRSVTTYLKARGEYKSGIKEASIFAGK